LSAYSRYLTQPDPPNGPCVSRQRLHLIYVLNDAFHHARYHYTNPPASSPAASFEPILLDLFRDAASEQNRATCRRLKEVLKIWANEEYISRDLATQLDAAVVDPAPRPVAELAPTTSLPKELPYMMPGTHGDPSLPFYELPAANFMPHILPNRKISMRTDSIRPLQFAPGPADDALVNAVKDFLKDVERIDNTQVEDEGIVADIDDLGQTSYHNEAGDVVGDTYYGWSRAFCERMRSRNQRPANGSRDRTRSRSYSSSPSRSRSRSREPRLGKRRYSRSRSDRSMSTSRSRRRSRYADDDHMSRSPSTPRFAQSANRQPTPQVQSARPVQPPPPPPSAPANLYQPPSQTFQPPPPPPPPPLMPGYIPVPPPRPPNWPANAPWPPAPPPPPGGSNGFPPTGQPSYYGGQPYRR
jgi:hypothetical protein